MELREQIYNIISPGLEPDLANLKTDEILQAFQDSKIINKDLEPIEIIKKVVANYFDLSIPGMEQKNRAREFCYPRQVAHYFTRQLTKLSLAKIGQEIGGKDHGTILNSIKVVSNFIETDKEKANEIKELELLINQNI